MLRGCEPEDLVQMVMSRLLAGTRRWPRDVAKEAFFVEAMRSCADQYSYDSTLQARSLVFESETVADDEDQTPVEKAKANVSNPGEVLEYSQEIERIQKHFENSEVELGVIMWRAEEYSPEEIQQEFSLTPTQYASTLKKIRRYVLRTRKE
jgi:DNA-directed RNA polymerase specialized sigma24 family protein